MAALNHFINSSISQRFWALIFCLFVPNVVSSSPTPASKNESHNFLCFSDNFSTFELELSEQKSNTNKETIVIQRSDSIKNALKKQILESKKSGSSSTNRATKDHVETTESEEKSSHSSDHTEKKSVSTLSVSSDKKVSTAENFPKILPRKNVPLAFSRQQFSNIGVDHNRKKSKNASESSLSSSINGLSSLELSATIGQLYSAFVAINSLFERLEALEESSQMNQNVGIASFEVHVGAIDALLTRTANQLNDRNKKILLDLQKTTSESDIQLISKEIGSILQVITTVKKCSNVLQELLSNRSTEKLNEFHKLQQEAFAGMQNLFLSRKE